MQSIKNKVLSRIYGHSKGWCFSQKDFLDISSRNDVDKALSSLKKEGHIRRINRGLYDYPKYSGLLKTLLNPDVDQAAQAIARKQGWRIQPTGAIAANLLGLSEQVPAKVVYLSDGHSKEFKIGKATIRFKHSEPKELNVRNRKSALAIQALRYMGQHTVNKNIILKIRAQLSETDRRELLRDARYGTDWIFEVVKKICKQNGIRNG